jgi:ketosteroid isomerase-like protein
MKHARWRIAPFAGLLICGLLACAPTLATQDPDRAALEAAIGRWITAVNARDEPALIRSMTEDAELLDSRSATAMSGGDAILALREVAGRGKLVTTIREITISGEIAWHVAALVQIQKNGDVVARGQALGIWKRATGEWKLHRQMTAGLFTPAISLTRPPSNEPVLDEPRK